MSIKAMKQALDLLETSWGCGHQETLDRWNETIEVLYEAIEQAEKQEPSLWFAIGKDGRVKYTTDSDRALKWKQAGSYRLVRDYYTAPPEREWVGLTDEEIWAEGADNVLDVYFARDIEAKLKEKNCPSAD
jgi:hypothetical protein